MVARKRIINDERESSNLVKIAFCIFVSQEERRPLMSKSGRKLVLKNILLFLTNKCTWHGHFFIL